MKQTLAIALKPSVVKRGGNSTDTLKPIEFRDRPKFIARICNL